MSKKNKAQNKRKTVFNLSVAIIIFLIFLCLIFFVHIFRTSTRVSGKIPVTPSSSSSSNPKTSTKKLSNGKNPANNNTASNSNVKNSPGSQTSTQLIAPFGSFVSDHHPDLSGSPNPSSEESVCNTSPGAQCIITFSNNGIIKTLPIRTANNTGSVYWTWDVKTLGFTIGNWQIKVTSSLDGTSKSSYDTLVVGQ